MADNLPSAEMSRVLEEALVGVPPVEHDPGTSALQALRASQERREEIARRADALLETMPSILAFVAVAAGLGEDVLGDASDMSGLTWKQVFERLAAGMQNCLSSDNPAVRRAVCLPMLRRRLDCPEATQQEVKAVLEWAHQQGFLVLTDEGAHKLSDSFGLTAEDKAQLAPLLTALEGNIPKKAKPAKIPKLAKAAEAQASMAQEPPRADRDITPGKAWRREFRGQFKLEVPANGGGSKGGILTMEAQDHGMLFVVAATNGFRDLESRAMPLSCLQDKEGDLRDNLVLVPPPLPPERLDQWKSQMERLGGILQRGFRAALEGKKDMSPAEFLTNNGPVGDSLITFKDFNWEPQGSDEERFFPELSLRFRRRDDGNIALVEILTPEAEGLLEWVLDRYQDPGQSFMGMGPLIVRNFLRAAHGRFAPREKKQMK